MHLYTQFPYWLMKNGSLQAYPSLKENIAVDVAIIGAGVSGALAAYYLRDCGRSLAIFDRRHAGMGSTVASTSFLQYEIDEPLHKLSKIIGEKRAVQSYSLCKKAIYDLQAICKLSPLVEFSLKPSLQFASYKKDIPSLKEEYEQRQHHGFDVEWMSENDLKDKFGIEAPAGIFSADGGQVDAYRLTHALLDMVTQHGHCIYNNTDIKEIQSHTKGVYLYTESGLTVKAKKLIIAAGYESLKYIPKKIADVRTTYAIVSEPVSEKTSWYKDSLVWETADPYLYFRKTGKDRILIGGKDDPYHHPHIATSIIKKKAAMLEQSFNKRMPHNCIKADYSWAGVFMVTKDGLPYIGTLPGQPHTYFALGYGGNGITFSVIAAEMIRDMILQKKNKHAGLFSFDRA